MYDLEIAKELCKQSIYVHKIGLTEWQSTEIATIIATTQPQLLSSIAKPGGTYRVLQKWNGCSSLLWICAPVCDICPGSIVLTHCSRLATVQISARPHGSDSVKPCVYYKRNVGLKMSCYGERSNHHLCILECLMSAREGSFDRQWCRINLANSWC